MLATQKHTDADLKILPTNREERRPHKVRNLWLRLVYLTLLFTKLHKHAIVFSASLTSHSFRILCFAKA